MNRLIKIGGVGIILAVLGIFVFILSQVLPLFMGAKVKEMATLNLPDGAFQKIGLDEWGELPFVVTAQGDIHFVDLKNPGQFQETSWQVPEGLTVTALSYHGDTQTLILGGTEGRFLSVQIQYRPEFENEKRHIVATVSASPILELSPQGGRVTDVDYGSGAKDFLVAGILQTEQGPELHAVRLTKSETLLGEGELQWDRHYDLSPYLTSPPQQLRVSESGDLLLVATQNGTVHYFQQRGGEIIHKQSFKPFAEEVSPQVATMDFLLGGVSVFLTHAQGKNVLYSLFIPKGGEERLFAKTKTFPDLPYKPKFFVKSLRNKSFLTGAGNFASLRHATTEQTRWEESLPFSIQDAALSKKYHRMAFLDEQNRLHLYQVEDPHPEAGWKAFFGKIWYEGAAEPAYAWQSTGGSDAFEPKLSLIPLIVGTLKGTFYALIFAIPISLLAAVYTSQFLEPRLKKIIKPVMEIMASLPSVILGFLAALWLAPLIEDAVPSLILVILSVPLAAIFFGYLVHKLPLKWRGRLSQGQEWLAFFPVLLAVAWLAWQAGPWLERWAFVVTDPSSGASIADFRLWWPQVTGTSFEQRNSLVVGFIMGFAVIPIIFTISEDSLSAVPKSLRSASLALGASRWQTALRVVLPAATAGIFSAVMIGFGRAVGETMIVLMATGNTPIMDFNIFNGMRTLSANLAVELPEAPFHSTLYRTLFLGALVLFLMTFSVNSVAEMMRQRIRRKFKGL